MVVKFELSRVICKINKITTQGLSLKGGGLSKNIGKSIEIFTVVFISRKGLNPFMRTAAKSSLIFLIKSWRQTHS